MSDQSGARLPAGYYLDESDPDVVLLRRPDRSVVAVFAARGATEEAIEEAAREDYEGGGGR
jgi:hypothetical protein